VENSLRLWVEGPLPLFASREVCGMRRPVPLGSAGLLLVRRARPSEGWTSSELLSTCFCKNGDGGFSFFFQRCVVDAVLTRGARGCCLSVGKASFSDAGGLAAKLIRLVMLKGPATEGEVSVVRELSSAAGREGF
jgi:hypothetical protein